ncbi:glycosyltransferase family 2 protein [Thioalkalivibrio sulfidiphilus]|uniref:glycosyltransferase family 2 protein n=1 Tax=Thioalkalivibrio sulfidiphilus TaxID=1033854 RepID=UPI003BAEC977
MLDIVVVNWNAGTQLQECVHSILAHEDNCVQSIVIVDNGSVDKSADVVESLSKVEVIRAGENLGFAAACNLGVKQSWFPYVLFLNPDTRINRDSLSIPLEYMTRPENANVGICGIQLHDEHGQVSRSSARFPTLGRFISGVLGLEKFPGLNKTGVLMSDWGHDHTRQVDHVMGAFFMIRREVFEALGGFDERFFVYLEDLDLSFRAHKAGWKSMYLAEAQAYHAGGGTSRQVKAHRLFYSLRSRLLYGFKHFPRWQAWVLVGMTGVIEPFTRTAWCLARGDWAGVRHTWQAYRMLWGGMGRILRGDGRFVP